MENTPSGLYDELFLHSSKEKRSIYKGKDKNTLIINCSWLKIKDNISAPE